MNLRLFHTISHNRGTYPPVYSQMLQHTILLQSGRKQNSYKPCIKKLSYYLLVMREQKLIKLSNNILLYTDNIASE